MSKLWFFQAPLKSSNVSNQSTGLSNNAVLHGTPKSRVLDENCHFLGGHHDTPKYHVHICTRSLRRRPRPAVHGRLQRVHMSDILETPMHRCPWKFAAKWVCLKMAYLKFDGGTESSQFSIGVNPYKSIIFRPTWEHRTLVDFVRLVLYLRDGQRSWVVTSNERPQWYTDNTRNQFEYWCGHTKWHGTMFILFVFSGWWFSTCLTCPCLFRICMGGATTNQYLLVGISYTTHVHLLCIPTIQHYVPYP